MPETSVARRELKYLLDRCTADILRKQLAKVLPVDSAGSPEKGYPVRSLYFDTVYNSDFYDKDDGLEMRQKIRLRIYRPTDTKAKLEVKKKQGSDQWKHSATIDKADVPSLLKGDYGKLLSVYQSSFLQAVFRKMEMECYIPKTIIEYDRLAFIHHTNDTRITFDTSLRATEANFDLFSPQLSLSSILYPVILEVKYNRFLLSHIKSVLQMADQSPVSSSKYCLARQISLY